MGGVQFKKFHHLADKLSRLEHYVQKLFMWLGCIRSFASA